VEVPLSEHEQRVLQELEQALAQHDPAFAARVRSENVYRYAGRYMWWSAFGFCAGLALLVAFFTASPVAGFAGFLVMLGSLVSFWTNLRRMGKAGWADISRSLRADGLGSMVTDVRARLRNRFKRSGS